MYFHIGPTIVYNVYNVNKYICVCIYVCLPKHDVS